MSLAQRTDATHPHALSEEEVALREAILERAFDEHRSVLLRSIGGLLSKMRVQDNTGERTRADIAADVLCASCLSVMERAWRFDPACDPLPWIWSHAFNHAKRERAKVFGANASPGLRREVSASEVAGEEQSGADALEALQATRDLSLGLLSKRHPTQGETADALAELLAPLSAAERELIALSVFQGYDSPALAEALGTTPAAARKRLQRALDRLRDHIASHAEAFSWVENLPALLKEHEAARDAGQARRRGSASRPAGCHTESAPSQSTPHDLLQAKASASRSTDMKHSPLTAAQQRGEAQS